MNFREEEINIKRIIYKSNGSMLEGLLFKPKGTGKFPGIVFVHGHQSDCWRSSMFGYDLSSAGFAAFLPSQVGYGLSEGEADYCGPRTVQGVLDGIRIFNEQSFVNSQKIGVWGISRGAIVASILLTKEPNLFKVGILQSGAYEMKLNLQTTKIEGIKNNILKETGGTDKAFQERSSIYDMDKLSCPVLILHGANDERISVEQARLLDQKLNELGKTHETVILQEGSHFITEMTKTRYTLPFLEKYLIRDD